MSFNVIHDYDKLRRYGSSISRIYSNELNKKKIRYACVIVWCWRRPRRYPPRHQAYNLYTHHNYCTHSTRSTYVTPSPFPPHWQYVVSEPQAYKFHRTVVCCIEEYRSIDSIWKECESDRERCTWILLLLLLQRAHIWIWIDAMTTTRDRDSTTRDIREYIVATCAREEVIVHGGRGVHWISRRISFLTRALLLCGVLWWHLNVFPVPP